jgi:hypothetical protein
MFWHVQGLRSACPSGTNGPIGQQIVSDGRGGLWLPMPDISALPSFLVHYAAGKLTAAALPGGSQNLTVGAVSRVPGTDRALAGGYKHGKLQPDLSTAAVILQYS